MELSGILQTKLTDFLLSLPNINDIKSRQAFLYSAGIDSQLIAQIPFDEPPAQFVPLLISMLTKYGRLNDGRNALESVLKASKNSIGADKRAYCDSLILELKAIVEERRQGLPVLVHLHPDFFQELRDVLRGWNKVQREIEFIGIRPKHGLEVILLDKGKISVDEASANVVEQIRAETQYPPDTKIIVFTEKRLYDTDYYQLFVGGRKSNETPPNIGILSLQFLRRLYTESSTRTSMFRAIIMNILYALGTDIGLVMHDDTRACIMDSCMDMIDIKQGLIDGPKFCSECISLIEAQKATYLFKLVDSFLTIPNLELKDRDVTETILFREKVSDSQNGKFDYDIALSFSDNDRSYVEQLARALTDIDIKVFYDNFERAKLWGRNRQIYLTNLCRLRAKYCVVFVSQSYRESHWKNKELEVILSRAFEANEDYILPIRLDNSEMPPILSMIGCLDWHKETVGSITQLIQQKLIDYQNAPTNYLLRG